MLDIRMVILNVEAARIAASQFINAGMVWRDEEGDLSLFLEDALNERLERSFGNGAYLERGELFRFADHLFNLRRLSVTEAGVIAYRAIRPLEVIVHNLILSSV